MPNPFESDLQEFLKPYLEALQNNVQRRWAPHYLRGLLSYSRRKSIQPLANGRSVRSSRTPRRERR